MREKVYPTDLSDQEWELVAPLLPARKEGGRPAIYSRRPILNACFYLIKTGCQWRMLPLDFPKWKTVYHYWRLWRLDGTWEKLHTALREACRLKAGRQAQPSAGVVDSQSVKTTSIGGPERGYDGGKKVKGRKRHLLVDTQGLVIRACVHSAATKEAGGLKLLLEPLRHLLTRMKLIWCDGGYKEGIADWVKIELGWTLKVVQHPWAHLYTTYAPVGTKVDWDAIRPRGFHVLPRRWVVERTFGWLGQNRRLSKDYEYLPSTSEVTIYVSMIRLMLRRLAPQSN